MKITVTESEIKEALNLPNNCEVELQDALNYPYLIPRPRVPISAMTDLMHFYETGQRLQFIKVAREVFDCGLVEAKNFADVFQGWPKRDF